MTSKWPPNFVNQARQMIGSDHLENSGFFDLMRSYFECYPAAEVAYDAINAVYLSAPDATFLRTISKGLMLRCKTLADERNVEELAVSTAALFRWIGYCCFALDYSAEIPGRSMPEFREKILFLRIRAEIRYISDLSDYIASKPIRLNSSLDLNLEYNLMKETLRTGEDHAERREGLRRVANRLRELSQKMLPG